MAPFFGEDPVVRASRPDPVHDECFRITVGIAHQIGRGRFRIEPFGWTVETVEEKLACGGRRIVCHSKELVRHASRLTVAPPWHEESTSVD